MSRRCVLAGAKPSNERRNGIIVDDLVTVNLTVHCYISDGGVPMKALLFAMVWALGIAAAPATAGELKVGDPAPDFKLQATDGKTYQLSSLKGKQAVVLAWFPKAFTQGCTIECKSLAEHGDLI